MYYVLVLRGYIYPRTFQGCSVWYVFAGYGCGEYNDVFNTSPYENWDLNLVSLWANVVPGSHSRVPKISIASSRHSGCRCINYSMLCSLVDDYEMPWYAVYFVQYVAIQVLLQQCRIGIWFDTTCWYHLCHSLAVLFLYHLLTILFIVLFVSF